MWITWNTDLKIRQMTYFSWDTRQREHPEGVSLRNKRLYQYWLALIWKGRKASSLNLQALHVLHGKTHIPIPHNPSCQSGEIHAHAARGNPARSWGKPRPPCPCPGIGIITNNHNKESLTPPYGVRRKYYAHRIHR